MKNKDKILSLNDNPLAYMLMCPYDFDKNFKEVNDDYCTDNKCVECTKKWLQEEYKGGIDYLEEKSNGKQ